MRAALALTLASAGAATALFATLPVLGTRARSRRLAAYVPGRPPDPATGHWRRSGRPGLPQAIGLETGRLIARAVGSVEPLGLRLERVHDGQDPAVFRFRQGTAGLVAAVVGLATAVAVGPARWPTGLLVVGPVAVALALPEVTLRHRARRWSDAVRRELPVAGEQLVALLYAGRSPTSALAAVAARGRSPLRRDLGRVVDHLRRGGSLEAGLARWAEVSDLGAVRGLARVLALHHRTPDLAALIEREVDAIRDELHRDLLAQLDRRSQQVWIPVTVAALVPGAIFLLVPFFDALRLFGAAP